MAGIRNDLERLRTTTSQTSDASPFRTSCRNIITACRNSPLALANYCREGVLPALSISLNQVSASLTVSRPRHARTCLRCSWTAPVGVCLPGGSAQAHAIADGSAAH